MDQWNENRTFPPPNRWNAPNPRFQQPPQVHQQGPQQPVQNQQDYGPPYQNQQMRQDRLHNEPPHLQQPVRGSYQHPPPPRQYPLTQYNQNTQYGQSQQYPPPNLQQYQQQQQCNNDAIRNYPSPSIPPNMSQSGPPPNMNWPVLPPQTDFNRDTTGFQVPVLPHEVTNHPPQQTMPASTAVHPGQLDLGQQQMHAANFAPYSRSQPLQYFKSQHSTEKSEEETDKEWVTAWLRKLDKRIIVPTKPTSCMLTIPDAKSLLREALFLLRELSQIHMQLSTECQTADETTWNAKCRRVSTLKARLQEIQSQLIPKEKELAKKLTRIRKKRNRIKKRNELFSEQKEDCMQKREELHQQLDLWQNQIHQEDLRTRREKLLKKEADNILAEVRKKQAESTKALDLIHSLLKLRSLRKDAVQRKGLHTTKESDNAFSTKLATLEAILTKQLEDYKAEEKALQVMLESTREAEQIEKNKQFMIKVSDAEQVLTECLFGNMDLPSTDDPVFPFWKYYTQAEESLDSLLHIREEWDSYIVPPDASFGSSVPVSWVIPEEPTSNNWKKALCEELLTS